MNRTPSKFRVKVQGGGEARGQTTFVSRLCPGRVSGPLRTPRPSGSGKGLGRAGFLGGLSAAAANQETGEAGSGEPEASRWACAAYTGQEPEAVYMSTSCFLICISTFSRGEHPW